MVCSLLLALASCWSNSRWFGRWVGTPRWPYHVSLIILTKCIPHSDDPVYTVRVICLLLLWSSYEWLFRERNALRKIDIWRMDCFRLDDITGNISPETSHVKRHHDYVWKCTINTYISLAHCIDISWYDEYIWIDTCPLDLRKGIQ